MSSTTPNRVLPRWAREELGSIAGRYEYRVNVKPMAGLDQVGIELVDHAGVWTRFLVTMKSDWSDLARLRSGDLEEEIQERRRNILCMMD